MVKRRLAPHSVDEFRRFDDSVFPDRTNSRVAELPSFDLSLMVTEGIKTIRSVQRRILQEIEHDPSSAFEPLLIGDRRKSLLTIDLLAERETVRQLHRQLPSYPLLVVGEESLRDPSLDLSAERGVVALVDMIDGTDLLTHNLANWCSTITFYDRARREILAALVGMPHEGVYFATKDSAVPLKHRYQGTPHLVPVSGPSDVKDIENSCLAFYGQKLKNLLSVTRSGLLDISKSPQSADIGKNQQLRTRIYNLAGNPFAMRMIDGHAKIDAIFELQGQAPHDMVPGAFIAQRAGAFLSDLDGEPIDLNAVVERPADPNSRTRYILASTKELSFRLRQCLASDPSTIDARKYAAA